MVILVILAKQAVWAILAHHFRARTGFPKKKHPTGVWLGSTRRSQIFVFVHVNPHRGENPPRDRGCQHITAQRLFTSSPYRWNVPRFRDVRTMGPYPGRKAIRHKRASSRTPLCNKMLVPLTCYRARTSKNARRVHMVSLESHNFPFDKLVQNWN